MQAVRLSTGNPWKGTTDVFNRGDPSLAIMAAAIAAGLRDYAPESLRPKETYFRVGGGLPCAQYRRGDLKPAQWHGA